MVLAFGGLTQATVIVKYDFGTFNNETLAPSSPADHITASSFGYVGDGDADFTDHSSPGQAYEVYGGWPHDEYADYFYFTVAIESGWSLNLDARCIWFDASTSNMSGPTEGKVTYLNISETILRDNIEIGGSSWYTYKTNSTPTPTGLTGTIEVRIYGKDATSGGSFTVDNVILNGTVQQIPEPATVALLSLGALSLLRRKK